MQNVPNNKHGMILPIGDNLRNMLNKTIISDNDLHTILKEKGIFTCSNNREKTIPMFSSLIISPSEFEKLKEKQKTKEEKEKKRSSTIKCNIQNEKLIEILPKINFNEFIDTRYMNYEFWQKSVNFIQISDIHVRLEYKINRNYGNKSWFEQEKEFNASLDIKLSSDGLELTTTGIHTANETQFINNKLNNFLINDLKNKNYVEKNEQIRKITMKGLKENNELIMKFFLKLSTVNISSFLTFDTLETLNIEIDESTKSLPKDLEWMKEKIKKLKLDGEKVDKVLFITDNKFHQYIKCWSMTSKYTFDDLKGKGHCKIKYEFLNNKDGEFEIKIENIILEDKLKDKKSIEQEILEMVDNLKLSTYKSISKEADKITI